MISDGDGGEDDRDDREKTLEFGDDRDVRHWTASRKNNARLNDG